MKTNRKLFTAYDKIYYNFPINLYFLFYNNIYNNTTKIDKFKFIWGKLGIHLVIKAIRFDLYIWNHFF